MQAPTQKDPDGRAQALRLLRLSIELPDGLAPGQGHPFSGEGSWVTFPVKRASIKTTASLRSGFFPTSKLAL